MRTENEGIYHSARDQYATYWLPVLGLTESPLSAPVVQVRNVGEQVINHVIGQSCAWRIGRRLDRPVAVWR